MFTGLIEGQGTITDLIPEAAGLRLIIQPPAAMTTTATSTVDPSDPVRLGDSIAINGCCLTVVSLDHERWAFQAGEETLSKTNLGRLRVGDRVNLERALPANGRLGGHFVQGHVDGVGTVAAIDRSADWVTMAFSLPAALLRGLVPKGSIAVDGISLTVVTVTAEQFTVALIPHTLAVTTLGVRAVGDLVNVETDILGKYVQRFLPESLAR